MRSAYAVGCAAAAVIMLSAVACGTTRPAGTAAEATSGVARAAPTSAAGTCPVRHAWADEVTAGGRVAWEDSLPTDPGSAGITLAPLVVGGDAVFAEENAVYAIRLRDGHRLWHRAFSKKIADPSGAVYGDWAWSGTVVVLSGQVSDGARLTGLDAKSGAVRWTLRLPKSGLLGSQAQGADGTLAIQLSKGIIESVDLATGKVLWSRQAGASDGPVTAGSMTASSVTAAGGSGKAVGYDSRTGRVLWTARGLPQQTELTAADGIFLAWSGLQGGSEPTAVTALNPLSGKIEWRFDRAEPVTILGAGPARIGFATYVPHRRVYLVNPATGRVRWSAATFALAGEGVPGQFAETGSYVLLSEGSIAAPPADPRIVARSAASGRVLWTAAIGASGIAGLNLALVPLPGGQAVAVTTTTGTGPALSARLTLDLLATGRRLASAALPAPVSAPLVVTGTSVLAQPDLPGCAIAAVGTAS